LEDLFERGSVHPVTVVECGTYVVWCFMLRNDAVPTPRLCVKENNRVEVPPPGHRDMLTKISPSDQGAAWEMDSSIGYARAKGNLGGGMIVVV
jgi:hypothetical protein